MYPALLCYLASTNGASAEAKGRDVRMPPTSGRVEEGVSAKVAAFSVPGLGPRAAAGGAAGALLDDRGGAVGGRTNHRVTLDLAPLTAGGDMIIIMSSSELFVSYLHT